MRHTPPADRVYPSRRSRRDGPKTRPSVGHRAVRRGQSNPRASRDRDDRRTTCVAPARLALSSQPCASWRTQSVNVSASWGWPVLGSVYGGSSACGRCSRIRSGSRPRRHGAAAISRPLKSSRCSGRCNSMRAFSTANTFASPSGLPRGPSRSPPRPPSGAAERISSSGRVPSRAPIASAVRGTMPRQRSLGQRKVNLLRLPPRRRYNPPAHVDGAQRTDATAPAPRSPGTRSPCKSPASAGARPSCGPPPASGSGWRPRRWPAPAAAPGPGAGTAPRRPASASACGPPRPGAPGPLRSASRAAIANRVRPSAPAAGRPC